MDKHSTGGVGDKTSLILTPIIAALGVPVAKMSGRGLGHTGGTIDKLECFEGFSTSISEEAFLKQVSEVGVAIAGQTANLAPADKKLYALRDVTATVAEKSLIASSIMSKKLASGSDAIVLDVKTGNGAFMQTVEKAEELARIMVAIGNGAGKKTYAVITDMSQPLGNTVGNIVEVQEAIEALNGKGPKDLMDVVYALGYLMLKAAGVAEDENEARTMMEKVIASGKALDKFADFVEAQGGRKEQVYHPQLLAKAAITETITAPEDGYVEALNAMAIGTACMSLGGGRETKESQIDLTAGIRLKKKIGDSVKKGECLAELYGNDAAMTFLYMRKNNKKELKKDIKNHMVESLELPKDLVYRAAIVTVMGNRELLLENYKGILEYEKEYIRIQAKSCRILVRGKNLNISYYTNEEMKITGIIQSIEYE